VEADLFRRLLVCAEDLLSYGLGPGRRGLENLRKVLILLNSAGIDDLLDDVSVDNLSFIVILAQLCDQLIQYWLLRVAGLQVFKDIFSRDNQVKSLVVLAVFHQDRHPTHRSLNWLKREVLNQFRKVLFTASPDHFAHLLLVVLAAKQKVVFFELLDFIFEVLHYRNMLFLRGLYSSFKIGFSISLLRCSSRRSGSFDKSTAF
jgi:hypothetical protein